jgi:hypothetical protein
MMQHFMTHIGFAKVNK